MTLLDRRGNPFIALHAPAEPVDANIPWALVVVATPAGVLLIYNGKRAQWELPGGTREPGETPHQNATRELREETGITTTDLDFAALAEFGPPPEYLALYRLRLDAAPTLVRNPEALSFRWWDPDTPPTPGMSRTETELARRVLKINP
ncbi:NUDIX hydrolase [Actinokineospora auranticolor]|uniref:NUDIX domain-containing protein n=1 Tax=Actinokineospora auranticolor TaxID=155976 RepID=A0A2S6GYN9_9PSEU|nr:NUDIX hydrolase [Actinokineospora auranticolor]PPK70271.1 NUDIX domain-containing protein [Actinokineospora auranticolor]